MPFGDNTLAILANSLYFKAPWDFFPEEKTKKQVFHGTHHDEMVEMMTSRVIQNQYHYQDNDFEVISLTFGNNAYFLKVMIPSDNLSLDEAVNLITPELIDKMTSESERCMLTVSIPKFSISSDLKLNNALSYSGVSSFMDGDNYTMFNSLPEGEKYMSVFQNTSFGLSEKGAEVASVTSGKLDISYGSVPNGEHYIVTIDRPFFFYIVEGSSQAWITSGFVANIE